MTQQVLRDLIKMHSIRFRLQRHCIAAGTFALLGCWMTHETAAAANEVAPADPKSSLVQFNETLIEAERRLVSGDREKALELLAPVLKSIEQTGTRRQEIVADSLLGRAHLQLGEEALADPLLRHAADLASASSDSALIAAAYNDLGLYFAVIRDEDAAFGSYVKAFDAAQAAGLSTLAIRIEVNRADLLIRRGGSRLAQQALDRGAELLQSLPQSLDKLRLSTALAARMLDVAEQSPEEAHLDSARSLLADAIEAEQKLDDLRAESLALGESSRLELQAGSLDVALNDAQRAIFSAQAAQSPELLYRWQWQAGRIQAKLGHWDVALNAYRRAMTTLQPLRHDLLLELRASGRSYRDTVGPLFLEYCDLLLGHAHTEGGMRQHELADARDAIEQLKTVELEDYFHDDCTARFQTNANNIDRLPPRTAVIYPIILPDRLEILLSVGGNIEQFRIAVPGKQLSDEALRFRKLLVKRSTQQYLDSAQRLFGWLIQPLSASLQANGVDMLVIVPDGALLGIPFAALHDEQDFLVRRYAIATVPGLHFIEPGSTRHRAPRALVGGLSDSVQGFPALPGVKDELRDVSQLYHAQMLDNQNFTQASVEKAVDNDAFTLVHIASHGKFEGESSKSFLLTYDGHLGMDSLERIVRAGQTNDDVLDLLTLSACETAAGDERAELGLAGVAVNAGARSVVATLWNINDEAASGLIRDFYHELAREHAHISGSKAKALQAAQLHLLADPRYRHPAYWAPFLMIGNWT